MKNVDGDVSRFSFIDELPGISVIVDAEFGAKTTYRVGGRSAAEIACEDITTLQRLLNLLTDKAIFVLGNGSNTLVSERGWQGIVVVLKGEFQEIAVSGQEVILGSSVSLPTAARQLAGQGLTGLEWAVGIPGTAGGAVKMNAGGHGSDTSSWLKSALVFRNLGESYQLMTHQAKDLEFGYRSSNLSDSDVVVSASFELNEGEPSASKRTISEIVAWRRENQPGGQNAGSVFINPDQDHAARLIESIGLKGTRIGSAEVSTRHANFIQADKGGSADDVFELIWLVQQDVEKKLGIRLRTEIKMLGFDSDRVRYLRGEI